MNDAATYLRPAAGLHAWQSWEICSPDDANGRPVYFAEAAPVAVATSDAERAAFEATVGKDRMVLRDPHGDYVSTYVQNDWDVWQVACKEIQRAACNFCLAEAAKARAALPIDFKQATELLAMFGGEPGEVTLLTGEGHSGRGLYAHATGHGEDGAEFLGTADDEAAPEVSKQATDQGEVVLPPSFAKLADAKTLAKVLKMNLVSGVLAPLAAELCQSLEEMVLATEGYAFAAPTLLGVADGESA